MALPFFKWSKTPASNSTASASVNWAEGQAPSTVNDSGRGMMADSAAYRDDNSGSLTTAGTSTAYTIATNQVFDSLANLNGQALRIKFNSTNGVSPTLNVDGLGAGALQSVTGTAIRTGQIPANSVWDVVATSATPTFTVVGVGAQEANAIFGEVRIFAGTSAPSLWLFCFGQAVSRTTYAALFAAIGTTYGAGDGSTTFNLPDLRGRVIAGQDDMGGTSANRLTGITGSVDGDVLGAVGGAESVTLDTTMIPAHGHSITDPGHIHTQGKAITVGQNSGAGSPVFSSYADSNSAVTGISIQNTGGGLAHANVPPLIVLNYIIYAGA